jgi:hypothetical protein
MFLPQRVGNQSTAATPFDGEGSRPLLRAVVQFGDAMSLR